MGVKCTHQVYECVNSRRDSILSAEVDTHKSSNGFDVAQPHDLEQSKRSSLQVAEDNHWGLCRKSAGIRTNHAGSASRLRGMSSEIFTIVPIATNRSKQD